MTAAQRTAVRATRDAHVRATVRLPCGHCGADIDHRPSWARHCSERCRKRAYDRRARLGTVGA